MKIDLGRRWSRGAFLAAIVAAAAPLAFFSGKVWLAEQWNDSARPALWAKAAQLEPEYADYWEHLGRYEQWSLEHGNLPRSIRYFQRATRADPLSADLWMELAGAYESAGDSAAAREAYEKAQADHPLSTNVAWRYGSFLLYRGDLPQGYAQIRRAVSGNHSLATSAIAECWEAQPRVNAILDDVLPAKADVYFAAIGFLLSQHQIDGALTVWQRLIALHQPIKLWQAFPLVNALIDGNRMAPASATWRGALQAANWPRGSGNPDSVVFNGGFERKIANGGFGWREYPVSDARIAIDGRGAHSGSRSLRIEFEGKSNLNFQNVFQLVPVRPRTRYDFSAYVRTDGLSTDQGIHFRIFDPRHSSEVQILTPNMTGTNPWTPVRVTVTTGRDTDLVEIALARVPTWKFDSKIHGTAWVDDVALVPAESSTKGPAK